MPARFRRASLLGAALVVFLFAEAAAGATRLQIAGAPAALEANIRAFIGPLPEADELTRRYQRRLRSQALEAAQALGYYNTQVEVTREQQGEDVVLTLQVEPGEPVVLSAVDVQLKGDARDDERFQELVEKLPLRVGEVLNHGEYEAAKRRFQNLALLRGYFEAGFERARVEVDAVDNTARVALTFASGPRYEFGEVRFSESPFRSEFLDRLVPFEPGDPYRAEAVAELNRALLASRYFETVRVRPLPEEAENGRVPVLVALQAQEKNRVGVGLGYSTDVGPRLRLTWAKPWLNSRGHSLSSSLELSEVRQQISAEYQIPLRDPLTDFLQFQTGYQQEDFEDTEFELFTLSVQRQQVLSDNWLRSVFVRFDHEEFRQADETGTSNLVLPGVSFTRTRSAGGIDPIWGDRLLLAVEATDPAIGSDVRLARGRVGGRWLRGAAERHRFLFRLDTGAIATSDFEQVPPSLRFFAGGDQSVRGFAFNSLSPRNAEGELTGGRYLITGSAEYGWHFRPDWRLATFIDAGNAFNDLSGDQLKVGTGFGIAWISPVGPVRLDFAWGVSEDKIPFRLHFSLGPRF